MNDEFLRRSYERLLVIREQEGPDRALCPPVEEIQALVSREGDEVIRLRRLDHVMQCPECRKEFDLLRSVDLSRPRVPASNWPLWAFAAAIVLVAGATVVWQMVQPRADVLRGSSSALALVSPADGAVLRLPASLTWHATPGALSYRVDLLDDTGGVTWSSTVTDTTIRLENMPVGAVAGWKVMAEYLNGVPLESPARKVTLEAGTTGE